MPKVHILLSDQLCALNSTCVQSSAKVCIPLWMKTFMEFVWHLFIITSTKLHSKFSINLPYILDLCLAAEHAHILFVKLLSCKIYVEFPFSLFKKKGGGHLPSTVQTQTSISVLKHKWQRWAQNICAFILMWWNRQMSAVSQEKN